jgi:citrate synthase
MTETSKYSTQIGSSTSDTTRLRIRGKDTLEELVGHYTFSEAFYLAVTGLRPSAAQLRMIDAALVVMMDHGLTPSALVARLVSDSLPNDPQVAIAAGVMMVGDKFAGTVSGAARLAQEGAQHEDGTSWARRVADEAHADRRRLPGFGHPYFAPDDPRSERLFGIARETGLCGVFVERIRQLSAAIDRVAGKRVTLNVTGALGAVLLEAAFPLNAARGLVAVSRAAGLCAHVVEEQSNPIAPHIIEVGTLIPYEDT